MENDFIKASRIEREKMDIIFKKYNVTDYEYSPDDGFDGWDGKYTNSKGEQIIYEVKVREIASDKYKEVILNKSKVDNIVAMAKQENRIPFAFIFFNDNKVGIINLTEWWWFKQSTILVSKTTMGDQTKINRKIYNIKIDKLINL